MQHKRLSIIRLLEPQICLKCRFGEVINILQAGEKSSMIRCIRLDCDNWDRSSLKVIDEDSLKWTKSSIKDDLYQ